MFFSFLIFAIASSSSLFLPSPDQLSASCANNTNLNISSTLYMNMQSFNPANAQFGSYLCIDSFYANYSLFTRPNMDSLLKGKISLTKGWSFGYYYPQGTGGLPVQIGLYPYLLTNMSYMATSYPEINFVIYIGNTANQSVPTVEILYQLYFPGNDRCTGKQIGNFMLYGYSVYMYDATMNPWKTYCIYGSTMSDISWSNVDLFDLIQLLLNQALISSSQFILGMGFQTIIYDGAGWIRYNFANSVIIPSVSSLA